MSKAISIYEEDTIQKLETKIQELEKTNLRLQKHFAKLLEINHRESITPYNGEHSFLCSLRFTISLKLNKVVWVNGKKNTFNFKQEKFFLKDIEPLSNKLIAQSDRKRFLDIINQSKSELEFSFQTLLRINHCDKSFVWGFALFQKLNCDSLGEQYLQVEIIKLDENEKIARLYGEFIKKFEKGEHYHKIETLTERQREVLSLLGKGLTSKEIAEHLNISFHTVEAHRKKIAQKTQIKKRAALVCLAAEVGIIK
jgi:DNA-binding CsgD family transcriptional regulator